MVRRIRSVDALCSAQRKFDPMKKFGQNQESGETFVFANNRSNPTARM